MKYTLNSSKNQKRKRRKMNIKLMITPFKFGVISLIFAVIISCNKSIASKELIVSEKSISPGKVVSKMEQKILVIFQDSKNNIWFGGNDKGVYRYDGKELIFYSAQDGLIGTTILGIQEDRFGNLYFDATEGVSKFDGKEFKTLEVVENGSLKNEWKSEPNDLWFRMGWNSNGPYRFDGQHLYHLSFPKNKMEDEFLSNNPMVNYNPYGIYYIYKDRKENIWFGTSNLGLYHFDGKEIRWMYEKHLTETPEGGSFGIRSIIEDKEGYIWICNPKYKYKPLQDTSNMEGLKPLNYIRESGLETQESEDLYALSMVLDNDGDLWMVTYNNGVWKRSGTELIHYPIKDGEMDVLLFSIYKDHQGALWLGTQNAGVYKYNGTTFEKYKI